MVKAIDYGIRNDWSFVNRSQGIWQTKGGYRVKYISDNHPTALCGWRYGTPIYLVYDWYERKDARHIKEHINCGRFIPMSPYEYFTKGEGRMEQKQHIAEDDWAELKRQMQELTFEDVFKALGGVPQINKIAPPPPPPAPPQMPVDPRWLLVRPEHWTIATGGTTQSVVYKPNRIGDPDGHLVPLPKPVPTPRTISAPQHDFIGALYKPYEPIA